MLEGRTRKLDRAVKHPNNSIPSPLNPSENGNRRSPNEDNIMTRKPIRIRRPRIPILQSGYCAICNLPYNSVEDHVQSKKHQKLIGEDANYIALNGYIHADVGIESLLSLTGIDAIGFEEFSPKTKRKNMPKTRASSVVSDIVKSNSQSQDQDKGHRLRSRKNIKYMSPSLEDDSFQEKLDLEPVRLEYKEYRELRSSTRALAKLTQCASKDDNEPEVWESGRPKRACIRRQKPISTDERLGNDSKPFYKVEVLSNKLRSSDKERSPPKSKESKANNDSEKELIVKFKKLRNSELVQLNNEATNFLFPKRCDQTEDDDENEQKCIKEERGSSENNTEAHSMDQTDSELKPPDKFKVEDEASMDSTASSEGKKKKKKRRTQVEAFILDNQKYYKFETPSSRLRYHGSYLAPVAPKPNGDLMKAEPKEEKKDINRLRVNLDEFTFSFETVPEHEKWYQTFRRQDQFQERYDFSENYHWNDFVLPHKIPHLKPLDPRVCYQAYKELKQAICSAIADSKSEETCREVAPISCELSEEVLPTDEAESSVEPTTSDDCSKLSGLSSGSAATAEEIKEITSNVQNPSKRQPEPTLSPSSSRNRNARKSPRQHASTLAILSSLVHQRKRRCRNAGTTSEPGILQVIPEEPPVISPEKPVVQPKIVTSQKQRKKKVDYFALAAKIDEELGAGLDFDIEDFQPTTDPDVSFLHSKLSLTDIMKMYEDSKAQETERSCKKFFNGSVVRKPGKRKKNLTGWPNKVKKRKAKESISNEGNHESEEDGDSDSIIEPTDGQTDDIEDRENNENRVENNSEIRDILQPFVYVKKLDNCEVRVKKVILRSQKKRTQRRRRRLPSSAKPSRALRKCKNRWIRDR
ncbi:hypothetical protein ABEB36_010355 [Hypothenemus hampei]|uniref:DBF4-type domain-containing protein n=1 Tax=Hypothenemus hampei TaxID=57062 RepID=A0ABD1EK00_HYPHA